MHGVEPAGFVSLIAANAPSRPDLSPWLASLFVHPMFRKNGIGTALVEHCAEYATTLGLSKIHLYTSSAVEFYRNLGWEIVDTFEIEEKTEVIMSKTLISTMDTSLQIVSMQLAHDGPDKTRVYEILRIMK